ncbi:cytochrome P450 [Nakamurella antarctica]|nr:cytochrome P450 [Nakamurella antarctica]
MFGHLPRWTGNSLALIEEGARLGPVFSLQLWRPAVVGYSPDWNRLVLGDAAGFRSGGSLSQLSPYLSGGVVALDAPAHRGRRALMNPAFHRRDIAARFAEPLQELIDRSMPSGDFDASQWSSALMQNMIQEVFVGKSFPEKVLHNFLKPLDTPMPGPLLRRPFKIRRMQSALRTALNEADPTTLAPLFGSLEGGVEEARVAIAAAYDTTAHTLAFALWELAARPDLRVPELAESVVQETLRLYPAGWIGSRVATNDTEFKGRTIPAGMLILYSPYLTHRDPELWRNPLHFSPERFSDPLPPWGYIPFSAGERTCLGAALASLTLQTAVKAFADRSLTRVNGDGSPRGGLTLAPKGPLVLTRGS